MDESKNEPQRGFSRLDGYMNVLNRMGTEQDSSEAYEFVPEATISDADLAIHYEANGLFTKIVDIPAEKAATGNFDLNLSDDNIVSLVTDALEDLDWETVAAQAIKWSRLFGGALAVMLIDDGRGLEESVDWDSIKGVDEIILFERPVVEPDYYSMYHYRQMQGIERARSKFGKPQFFSVNSQYGSFIVHESRCLIFKNGILPESAMQAEYAYWGLPEYIRLKRALQETVTEHSNGGKLLERAVQGIYKMKGLTNMLSIEGGDDIVLRRLRTIDMARNFLNSIVIDTEGEDYVFQTFQLGGLKDVINVSCNMLSAVTNIPQTILFGASPDGMNATGAGDLENWYNYLGQIQKLQLRENLQHLLDVMFRGWLNTGKLQEEPDYKLEFKPFWNLSEKEQAELDKLKADTELVRAQTAQIYCDMQVLDPSEVRKGLAQSEALDIEELIGEDDLDTGGDDFSELEEALAGLFPTGQGQSLETDAENADEDEEMQDPDPGCGSVGVLVIKDDKILTGTRAHDSGHGQIGGPGGHIEEGETPKEAAIRETSEEFGIVPTELIPIGCGPKEPDTGLSPTLFLCTEYEGTPHCISDEMQDARFLTLNELLMNRRNLFEPFADSITVLERCNTFTLTPPKEAGGPREPVIWVPNLNGGD